MDLQSSLAEATVQAQLIAGLVGFGDEVGLPAGPAEAATVTSKGKTQDMTTDEQESKSSVPNALSPAGQPGLLHIIQRMRRAFLSICRCGDTLFNPYGITTDQYGLMLAVYRQPGIRQADIGSTIFAEPNTITAMLSLLEKRGILRRRPSPTDGRTRLVYLTNRGEKMTERLSEDCARMRELLYDCFAGSRGEEALKILDRVSQEMQREREKLTRSSNNVMLDGMPSAPFFRYDAIRTVSVAPSSASRARKVLKRPKALRAGRK
jgi:DNA-binding MarR family transcriptional regulator